MWKPRVTGSEFFSYEKVAGSSQLGRNLTQLHGRTEVWMVSARRALFQSTPSPDLHVVTYSKSRWALCSSNSPGRLSFNPSATLSDTAQRTPKAGEEAAGGGPRQDQWAKLNLTLALKRFLICAVHMNCERTPPHLPRFLSK